MKLIVDFSQQTLVNFYFAINFLKNKYNLIDAYFLFFNQRIFISSLQDGFFRDVKNWINIQAQSLVFTFVKNYTGTERMVYDYYSPYFISEDVYFLPFNWYTKRFIYWDNAAQSRGQGNNYFRIFSVGLTPIAFIRESDKNKLAQSGGSTIVFRTQTGERYVKLESDGKPIEIFPAYIEYPITFEGLICKFSDEFNSVTLQVAADDYNFQITFNQNQNPLINFETNFDFPVTTKKFQDRILDAANLDYIQSFQRAIIGNKIVIEEIGDIPKPLPFSNAAYGVNTYIDGSFKQALIKMQFKFLESYVDSVFYIQFVDLTNEFKIVENANMFFSRSNFAVYLSPNINQLTEFLPNDKYIVNDDESQMFYLTESPTLTVIQVSQGKIEQDGSITPSNFYCHAAVSLIQQTVILGRTDELSMFKLEFSDEEKEFGVLGAWLSPSNGIAHINISKWNGDAITVLELDEFLLATTNFAMINLSAEKYPASVSSPLFTYAGELRLINNTEAKLLADLYELKQSGGEPNIYPIPFDDVLSITTTENLFIQIYNTNEKDGDGFEKETISAPLPLIAVQGTIPATTESYIQIQTGFPSENEVAGYAPILYPDYPFFESALANDNLKYWCCRYQKFEQAPNFEIAVVDQNKNDGLAVELDNLAKQGIFPYRIKFNNEITEGIRMLKNAFDYQNYLRQEMIVSIIITFECTTTMIDGFYRSQSFQWPQNFAQFQYISLQPFTSDSSKKPTVMFSNLGVETYERQHPFFIENQDEAVRIVKPYQKNYLNYFYADQPFETVIMYCCDYANRLIYY